MTSSSAGLSESDWKERKKDSHYWDVKRKLLERDQTMGRCILESQQINYVWRLLFNKLLFQIIIYY